MFPLAELAISRISRRACVLVFFEICVLTSTQSVLFCFILLFRCETVCLVPNSAELLCCALASSRNRSPAYLFRRASDCPSWTEQIPSAADLVEVNTENRVKPSALLPWWSRNDTYLVESHCWSILTESLRSCGSHWPNRPNPHECQLSQPLTSGPNDSVRTLPYSVRTLLHMVWNHASPLQLVRNEAAC